MSTPTPQVRSEEPRLPVRAKPPCIVPGCSKPQVNGRENMCGGHRTRQRKYGNPGPAALATRIPRHASGLSAWAYLVDRQARAAAASVPARFPHAEAWREYLAGNARAHALYLLEREAERAGEGLGTRTA